MNTDWLHREIHIEDITPEFLLGIAGILMAVILVVLSLEGLFS